MLDLDLINSKPIEIKINKGLVKVNQPSFSLAKKVRVYEKSLGEITEEEIYKEQSDILVSFLNNNSSNKKFNDKDIDNLSFTAIKALYTTLINAIKGIEESPN
ncbi:hypothetical protein ACFO6R_12730 [Eubacterium multiforme]|uniref:Uncharacterized protein n=1 Tax=Eubacterium multiforme TaxID=83339 RepID=A0ABT9UWA9_9FIRM|nr:hypothetical protein [Eubacterium multiforme]MDQ0150566.1 hypothetical protein [Eubacterium multiforme]